MKQDSVLGCSVFEQLLPMDVLCGDPNCPHSWLHYTAQTVGAGVAGAKMHPVLQFEALHRKL